MSEQKELSGIIRRVSELSDPVKKGNFTWYNKELTFDNGQTYKRWSTSLDELNLEHLIDQEVKYSINDKGNVQLHGIPIVVTKPVPAVQSGVFNSESYWRDKTIRDWYDVACRERQYYINHAREFLVPLGKISEGNCEELAERAIQLGNDWHLKYGKYRFE